MNAVTLPNVSRETNDRLKVYAELVEKWNPRINLVSKSSIAHLWERHIADSAQNLDLAPPTLRHWVDLGSGGGFPGIVIAILLSEFQPDARMTLVESDQRKCAFLRSALRQTGCTAEVIADRIEDIEPLGADVLSARALADLDRLLGFAERHMKTRGCALFPKGARWQEEVANARSRWRFDIEVAKSRTDPAAAILKISGVSRD
ncbi:16S rRNA (guanine(527)-N(7))-methyltransferase RsmG [Roseovarius spongiae]|uniref:Ribosomal RNA small subunit methyltransferase G n=1 Tax=Roseovarius spongiae TaxID=2320272 RepID=A0A3A8AU24_9RHOB|nr:16S rRNA (guanine(527)-N(7))-methyltransferase RsmG [Roseovarius spongiae]RKF13371.1 16S rRNA (guanine(527)-N(7))-methyltransferase RsmG [Roseovarius spongiae]